MTSLIPVDATKLSSLLPAPVLDAINAGVQRFGASPAALASLDHNYTPSGDLHMPMVMLSNVRDPVVPGFNQTSYASALTATGTSDLLLQRQVNAYGHCAFSPADIGAARKVAPRTRLGRCAFREFFRCGVGCRMLVEANNLLARSSQLEIPSPLSSRPQ